MRLIGSAAVVLLGMVDLSSAWTSCLPKSVLNLNNHRNSNRRSQFGSALSAASNQDNLHEFEFLLHETSDATTIATPSAAASRRVVKVGGHGSDNAGAVILTSSSAASLEEGESFAGAESYGTAADEYDPYSSDTDYQQQMGKIQQTNTEPASLESRFKKMDIQDIVITLVIPGIISFVSLRWGFNKVAGRVSESAESSLASFAREMIYHDGNFDEMRMCHSDYSRQLMWMGPKKGDAMLKRYLAAYAKKKTVSPQSISTLSYVFTLFKLSEESAGKVLISLCREMGTEKISTAGKILFFGSRIIKSPEGKKGLEPIKDLIKSTYRDEEVADTLVETSQQAIGEAAYRSTVLAGGKGQKALTIGWEVLGLDKETATRIFEGEAEEGFVSERETMYGGQTRKYDKKGNRLDKDQLENPEDAAGDDEEDDSATGPASNIYSCGNCGYTLFIAKGREFKFYGDDFKCPECGALKDEFKPADIEEE